MSRNLCRNARLPSASGLSRRLRWIPWTFSNVYVWGWKIGRSLATLPPAAADSALRTPSANGSPDVHRSVAMPSARWPDSMRIPSGGRDVRPALGSTLVGQLQIGRAASDGRCRTQPRIRITGRGRRRLASDPAAPWRTLERGCREGGTRERGYRGLQGDGAGRRRTKGDKGDRRKCRGAMC